MILQAKQYPGLSTKEEHFAHPALLCHQSARLHKLATGFEHPVRALDFIEVVDAFLHGEDIYFGDEAFAGRINRDVLEQKVIGWRNLLAQLLDVLVVLQQFAHPNRTLPVSLSVYCCINIF